ncbi:MAG: enolase [Proteobacteria bacterium]|nr:enolase [Pseudomonadota bacterium]
MIKIAEIHTTTFRLPMSGTLRWGKAGRMSEVIHVLVRLVTDTGHLGLAEAVPRPYIYGETPESVHAIIQQHLAPDLIGLDIADTEAFNRVMESVANNHTAKGAIDICLHEARAGSQGKSLLAYLNPPKRKVEVSYILGLSRQKTMLAEARAAYDRGVRVFKIKVGEDVNREIVSIKALQAEFEGGKVRLYADANQCLLPGQVHSQIGLLAGLGILYVEEPLPVETIPTRANLKNANILPLVADDSAMNFQDLTRELYFDTFDILNIKPARTGYTTSNRMLASALKHGKGVMVGSQASSTLGTIRAAFFAGRRGIDYPSELSFFLKLEDDIVTNPVAIRDGCIDLDELADITIDEKQLERFAE